MINSMLGPRILTIVLNLKMLDLGQTPFCFIFNDGRRFRHVPVFRLCRVCIVV